MLCAAISPAAVLTCWGETARRRCRGPAHQAVVLREDADPIRRPWRREPPGRGREAPWTQRCPPAAPVRVLVADDEDDIRDLVCLAVRKAGCAVVRSVADGAAALAAARADLPDLAVLDVSMPGATGLQVCEALRGDPATAGIRILLLSAGASPRRHRPRPRRRRRRLPAQALRGRRRWSHQIRALTDAAAGMTTAVLGRSATRARPRRWLLRPGRRARAALARALPTTALLAATTALVAAGGAAGRRRRTGHRRPRARFPGHRDRPAGRPPAAAGDGALLVPVTQLAAVGPADRWHRCRRQASSCCSGRSLSLALTPGRRGVVLAGTAPRAALLVPDLLTSVPVPVDLSGALRPRPAVGGRGHAAVHEAARRSGPGRHDRAAGDRAVDAGAQVRTRADELDVATRMLAARAQTMTSVIDAVTEQSIIGTDRDGVIRVWNPGAEKMLGLPRLDVVRKRSIVDFHLPEELEAVAEDVGSAAGLGALVHAAQEHGSDVRDWTYLAADGRQRHGRRGGHPAHRRPRASTPAGTSSAPT